MLKKTQCTCLIQTAHLVIPIEDFRKLFMARFHSMLHRFLYHQYGNHVHSNSSDASSNNKQNNQMPSVVLDEKLLYIIQFLFEYMITKYITSTHNAYCSPWLLIDFRVNPETAKFLVTCPQPTQQQRGEIEFLRHVLTPAEIERRYSCGGMNQDIQPTQLLRRSLALDLGEN